MPHGVCHVSEVPAMTTTSTKTTKWLSVKQQGGPHLLSSIPTYMPPRGLDAGVVEKIRTRLYGYPHVQAKTPQKSSENLGPICPFSVVSSMTSDWSLRF